MSIWKRGRSAAADRHDRFDLLFGGVPIPRHLAADNFLFAGQRGSGKTFSIRLLTQSAVDAFYPGSKRRAVIYDPKGDWPSIVAGMLRGLRHDGTPYRNRVKNLNPFHAEGWAYDLAAEFTALGKRARPASIVADCFAKALLPEKSLGGDNDFWVHSAQGVLSGLVQSYAKFTPTDWTFRDVISAACDERLITAVLSRDRMTNRTLARFDSTRETKANVLQTLASFAWDLEPAATAWEHHGRAGRRLSCDEWFQSEDILILCGSYKPASAVEPINGLFMNFIREHLTTQPEIEYPLSNSETWFVLDEFPKLHAIRDMVDFFSLSRSKGGIQVIGFQSVPDVYAKYEEDVGDSILGMCGLAAVLRLTCPRTARYFEDRIGKYEVKIPTRSSAQSAGHTDAASGRSVNVSLSQSSQEQFMTLPGVLGQQFMTLSPVRPDVTIDGWYVLNGRYSRLTYSAKQVGLLDPDTTVPDFIPIDVALTEPRPWGADDFDRLKVEAPPGYATSGRKPAAPRAGLLETLRRVVSPPRTA